MADKAANQTPEIESTDVEIIDGEAVDQTTGEILPTVQTSNVAEFDPSVLDTLDDYTDDDAGFSLNFKTDLGLQEGESRNYLFAGENSMTFKAKRAGDSDRTVSAPVLIDSERNSYSIPNAGLVSQLCGGFVSVGSFVRITFKGIKKLEGGRRMHDFDVRILTKKS